MNDAAKLLTEFVGTFIFLSVIALSGPAGPLAPLAIGAALMVMVYMGGHVSGGHYNPAVSFGLFLRRKIDIRTMAGYWLTQLVAGALAFVVGYLVSGRTPGIQPGSGVLAASALTIEILFTVGLVLVVLNVAATPATAGNSFYGLAIGFTIVVGAFVGGPISGGAFNPAVGFGATLGAALFHSGSWSHLWLYIVGPLVGAAVAAGIHYVQVTGLEGLVRRPPGRAAPGRVSRRP
ncbi:MAG TPA: aquaporin [Candidatus Dormibacteraeota bacterium]|nr:aquaporin [Candidatus Dormibacteraeota bacterium]